MFSQFHTLRYNWIDYLSDKSIEGCSRCSSNISEKLLVLKINNLTHTPPEITSSHFCLCVYARRQVFIFLKNTSSSNFSKEYFQLLSDFFYVKSLNQFIKVQSIILLCFGLFIFKEQSNNDKEYVPERG